MVKNIKLLIIAIGSFVYVQGQHSTKMAAPVLKADTVVPSVESFLKNDGVATKSTFTDLLAATYVF